MQFIWLALGIVFLLPFFDPRRPLRLLHLDLLVLVGGAAAIMYPAYVPFGDASVDIAIGSAHLGMAYLVVRMLMLGFRPGRRSGPLVPVLPVWSLAAALAPLIVFRLAYVVAADPALIDTGGAGVIGADRILGGESLYGERFALDLPPHTDTYGVFLYLAYVPFELVFPVGDHFWQGGAQRVAAIRVRPVDDGGPVPARPPPARRPRGHGAGRGPRVRLGELPVHVLRHDLRVQRRARVVPSRVLSARPVLRPCARARPRRRGGGKVRAGGPRAVVRHRDRRAALALGGRL